MSQPAASSIGRHPIVITFLVMAVVAFTWWADEVLKPIALAILLALALAPLVRFLEKRGIPRIFGSLLSVLLTLVLVGLVFFEVGRELTMLLDRMPEYETNIKEKMKGLRSSEPSVLTKAGEAIERISEEMAHPTEEAAADIRTGVAVIVPMKPMPEREPEEPVMKVEIVENPGLAQRVQDLVGPAVELGAQVFIVLTLVIFFLIGAEDLISRLIALVGSEKITITTQTLKDAGSRIARYLGMFAGMNALTGVVIGLAMWAVGLEFPLLWGGLSAVFRFVPYLGPVLTLVLPVAFSLGSGPSLMQPMMITAIILIIELANNFVLEPIIYGKSTNVTPFGLVVAALFWTWMWGPLGLVLSTALTVSLTVAGKYIPSLRFFHILFGEESGVNEDVRFYQKLLNRKGDDALQLIEEAKYETGPEEAFDRFLVPTLRRLRIDRERGEVGEEVLYYIRRIIAEASADLMTGDPVERSPALRAAKIIGVAVESDEDLDALGLLKLRLSRRGVSLEILGGVETSLQITEKLSESQPDMIVISHFPPDSILTIRYLIRRLRSLYAGMPILVCIWSEGDLDPGMLEKMRQVGATRVVRSVEAAAAWLEDRLKPEEGLGSRGAKRALKDQTEERIGSASTTL